MCVECAAMCMIPRKEILRVTFLLVFHLKSFPMNGYALCVEQGKTSFLPSDFDCLR